MDKEEVIKYLRKEIRLKFLANRRRNRGLDLTRDDIEYVFARLKKRFN